jgi:hypothetical protein
VGLLDDEEERRDLVHLAQLEQIFRKLVDDHLLNLWQDTAHVDDTGTAAAQKLVVGNRRVGEDTQSPKMVDEVDDTPLGIRLLLFEAEQQGFEGDFIHPLQSTVENTKLRIVQFSR